MPKLDKQIFKDELDYQVSIAVVKQIHDREPRVSFIKAIRPKLLDKFKPLISNLWERERALELSLLQALNHVTKNYISKAVINLANFMPAGIWRAPR